MPLSSVYLYYHPTIPIQQGHGSTPRSAVETAARQADVDYLFSLIGAGVLLALAVLLAVFLAWAVFKPNTALDSP
jgi:hypothetical protein